MNQENVQIEIVQETQNLAAVQHQFKCRICGAFSTLEACQDCSSLQHQYSLNRMVKNTFLSVCVIGTISSICIGAGLEIYPSEMIGLGCAFNGFLSLFKF